MHTIVVEGGGVIKEAKHLCKDLIVKERRGRIFGRTHPFLHLAIALSFKGDDLRKLGATIIFRVNHIAFFVREKAQINT